MGRGCSNSSRSQIFRKPVADSVQVRMDGPWQTTGMFGQEILVRLTIIIVIDGDQEIRSGMANAMR